ncbi:hypothetical protein ACTPEM_22690, partial [Clostridioides difficile]
RANRAAKLVTEAKYADSKYCNIVYGNLVDKRGVCGSFASSFHVCNIYLCKKILNFVICG